MECKELSQRSLDYRHLPSLRDCLFQGHSQLQQCVMASQPLPLVAGGPSDPLCPCAARPRQDGLQPTGGEQARPQAISATQHTEGQGLPEPLGEALGCVHWPCNSLPRAAKVWSVGTNAHAIASATRQWA